MAHVEPAALVELALGHQVSSSDDVRVLRHIANCARCSNELNRLARVVAAARGVEASDLPVAPPEQVWQRITHEMCRTQDAAAPSPRTAGHRPDAMRTGEGRAGEGRAGEGRADHITVDLIRLVLALLAGAAVVRGVRQARAGGARRSAGSSPPRRAGQD
ncbi:hypothetical protein [Streptomyces sp. AC512_CC834]|uniref:hypothetical protein n=1 Tax=Streptomyces sp. AC512_CC834 TaxID=2823691 RepID=UPI001C26F316|nr:hypothetical protein [Streptomyces sp. AC512_CC834]